MGSILYFLSGLHFFCYLKGAYHPGSYRAGLFTIRLYSKYRIMSIQIKEAICHICP